MGGCQRAVPESGVSKYLSGDFLGFMKNFAACPVSLIKVYDLRFRAQAAAEHGEVFMNHLLLKTDTFFRCMLGDNTNSQSTSSSVRKLAGVVAQSTDL